MRVAIVGGGVVGLCCAWSLRRRGAQVTILERGRCGEGASWGNAGWITPILSAPVPAPGVMRQAAGWMLDPESPLYVRPSLHPAFLRWSYAFARACRPARARAGTAATAALAATALDCFDLLRAEGTEFEMHSEGLLFVARTPGLLGEYPGRRLSGSELRDFEPALSPSVVEGVHAVDERHVRPESLVAGLIASLHDDIEEGREVTDLRELLDFDRVVVAAGVHTKRLVPLPLVAAKGYSITAPLPEPPARPLYLYEIKVGASPFGGGFRLAGTLELGPEDLSLNARRIEAIRRGAGSYLRTPLEGGELWAGLRPLLPDGLPAIGRVDERTFVATGHSMLGITLGPPTGEALAPYVLTGEEPAVLRPLRPTRF
jgi:D-amino-acid dehydrogenase